VLKNFGTAFSNLQSSGRRRSDEENVSGWHRRDAWDSSPPSSSPPRTDDVEDNYLAEPLFPCFSLRSRDESITLCASWASEPLVPSERLMERILFSKQVIRSWKHIYNNLGSNNRSVATSSCDHHELGSFTNSFRTFVPECYEEFSRIRRFPKDSKTVRSRAGFDVVISVSASDVFEQTKSLPKGPLCVGSVLYLRSDRGSEGKLIVAGVRSGQVWYFLENDSTAWYFDVGELAVQFLRIQEGELSGIGLMEAASSGSDGNIAVFADGSAHVYTETAKPDRLRSTSDGDSSELEIWIQVSQSLTLTTYTEFVTLQKPKWTIAQDAILVELINSCATRLNTDPRNICAEDLLIQRSVCERKRVASSQISGAEATDNESADLVYKCSLTDLMIRYSLLVYLNRAVGNTLPYSEIETPSVLHPAPEIGGVGNSHELLNWAEGPTTLLEDAIRQLYPCCRVLQQQERPGRLGCLVSSSAKLISELKPLIFTFTKLKHWSGMVAQTTVPCTLPPDFGEMPRDIVDFKLDRELALRALAAVRGTDFSASSNGDPQSTQQIRLKHSLFGQMLQHFNGKSFYTSNWRAMRKSYVGDLDAGQQRAFRIDEKGAIDSGGPYRAFFEHSLGEEITTLLQLFVPCPNSIEARGLNQDKIVINTALLKPGGSCGANNCSPVRAGLPVDSLLELYTHVGGLAGVSCRHGLYVPLSLPELVLKPLTNTVLSSGDILTLDASLSSAMKRIVLYSHMLSSRTVSNSSPMQAHLRRLLSPSSLVDLESNESKGNGRLPLSVGAVGRVNEADKPLQIDAGDLLALQTELLKLLTSEGIHKQVAAKLVRKALINLLSSTSDCTSVSSAGNNNSSTRYALIGTSDVHISDILDCVLQMRLTKQLPAIRQLLHGLSIPLPVHLFPLFTATELDILLCGSPDFDVNVLKAATKYVDVLPNNKHVLLFWHVLEHEFNGTERSAFANFCCARSRLPSSAR
jgi:hypothetical protein